MTANDVSDTSRATISLDTVTHHRLYGLSDTDLDVDRRGERSATLRLLFRTIRDACGALEVRYGC